MTTDLKRYDNELSCPETGLHKIEKIVLTK
jgi:hypothetical protein